MLRRRAWHAYGGVPLSAYIGFEAAAEQISIYESMLVPGLLQTPVYARTILQTMHPNLSAEDIEQRVRVREVRQDLLTQDDPPTVRAVLDEAVLRRPIGGPETMREQRDRLAEAAALPTVTIHVGPAPRRRAHGPVRTFHDLELPGANPADVVYLENETRDSFLEAEEAIPPVRTRLRPASWRSSAAERLHRLALSPSARSCNTLRAGLAGAGTRCSSTALAASRSVTPRTGRARCSCSPPRSGRTSLIACGGARSGLTALPS